MEVILGSDHAGFEAKEKVRVFLEEQSIPYKDFSPELDPGDDYPDPAEAVAKKVVAEGCKGVLFCGNGIGVSIAANKVKGARAARIFNETDAKKAVIDDAANIITIAGREDPPENPEKLVKIFLETDFKHIDKYERRLNKVNILEENF